MKLPPYGADPFDEARLDVHVDILKGHGEFEIPGLDFRQDLLQSGDDLFHLGAADDSLAGQHAGMGNGTLDVVAVEALIETDGGGELLHESIRWLAEASLPGLFGH